MTRLLGISVCVLLLAGAANVAAQEGPAPAPAGWPQWRGPARTAITSEPSGSPHGWPPKKLWQTDVGHGCTSPILQDGKLYVMGFEGRRRGRGKDLIRCFDARSGDELWRQSYASRYHGRFATGDQGAYGGPSSTPTLDVETGLLYTLGIDGDLRCWDTRRAGESVWGHNLYDRLKGGRRPKVGGGLRDYGYTNSPLLLDDWVIVETSAKDGTVRAFDKHTGEEAWKSQYDKPFGHSSGPVVVTVDGKRCLGVLTLFELVLMRADADRPGRTLAAQRWGTDYACNIPTPAAAEESLIVTSGYNMKRTMRFQATPSGLPIRWRIRTHAVVSTPVVHDGRVYIINNNLHCLDLERGELLWKGGSFRHGSCLVTGDDKLIAFGRGKAELIEANPSDGKYTRLGETDRLLRGTCYPHVALSRGVLCLKDRGGALVCLSVDGK